MPTLLDLPQELLTLIHTHLLPDPIPFILTCKTICIRSEPTITLHNTYRTKWRHISHQGGESDAFYILDSIARDPLVAEYIEILHLRDMWDNSGEIRDYRGLTCDLPAMNRIIDMVVECPFLKEAGIDGSRWWDLHLALENSLSEPIIELPIATLITLLLFLPNLKELGLPRWWSIGAWERWADPSLRDDVMWMPHTLLSKMVQLARKPEMLDLKPKPKYRPLAKLKTLIPYETAGYDSRAGLQKLEPLLALPNLENVYSVSGMACFDGYTGIPFRWQTWHLRYNLAGGIALRRLEIAYGCCDAEGITAMLGNTPKLEVFKYSHQTKWHGCEHEWGAGLFVSALAKCVGKTLKQLALRAEHGCVPYGIPIFTNFDRLEELEIDVRILFRLGNRDGVMLQHRLPGNINKVLLNLERGNAASELYADWVSFIYGFGGVWKEMFPGLGSVVVRARRPDENEGADAYEHWDVFEDFESAGRLCETAGIGWKPLSKQRFNLMGWKRQFCERFDVT